MQWCNESLRNYSISTHHLFNLCNVTVHCLFLNFAYASNSKRPICHCIESSPWTIICWQNTSLFQSGVCTHKNSVCVIVETNIIICASSFFKLFLKRRNRKVAVTYWRTTSQADDKNAPSHIPISLASSNGMWNRYASAKFSYICSMYNFMAVHDPLRSREPFLYSFVTSFCVLQCQQAVEYKVYCQLRISSIYTLCFACSLKKSAQIQLDFNF